MKIITVDLDDTLIETSKDYRNSADKFSKELSNKYNINKNIIENKLMEIDKNLVDIYGVSKERYPMAFVKTLKYIVDNPEKEEIDRALHIGFSTYKTIDEYKNRGFISNSVDLLDVLSDNTNDLHLVTIGCNDIQSRKIRALKLYRWFDDVHIVNGLDKKEAFENIIQDTKYNNKDLIHIGNSAHSDIKSALEFGGKAGYYCKEIDWLSDKKLHNKYINDDRVYNSDNMLELTNIFKNKVFVE